MFVIVKIFIFGACACFIPCEMYMFGITSLRININTIAIFYYNYLRF